MVSLIEELKLREAAAPAEADRLRSLIKELSEDLARAEKQAAIWPTPSRLPGKGIMQQCRSKGKEGITLPHDIDGGNEGCQALRMRGQIRPMSAAPGKRRAVLIMAAAVAVLGALAVAGCGSPGSQSQSQPTQSQPTQPLTWTAAKAPLPANAAPTAKQDSGLSGLTCPTAKDCIAEGFYQTSKADYYYLTETLSRGIWTPGAWSPTTAVIGFTCPAVGTCVAVGTFLDSKNHVTPAAETLSGGFWAGATLPLPAGTPPNPNNGQDYGLHAASCPVVGTCVAVGTYQAADGTTQGLIETLSKGTWTAVRAPLPVDAKTSSKDQGNPLGLQGVTCPAAGYCVAIGQYEEQDGAFAPVIDTLSGGTWTAQRAPLPTGVAATLSDLQGVACRSAGDCVAVGQYVLKGGEESLIDTLSGGRWTAAVGPLPADGQAKGQAAPLSSVACSPADGCVAVGEYSTRNSLQGEGLIDTLSNGKWTAVRAPLPAGVTLGKKGYVTFTVVACPAADRCIAVGYYSANETNRTAFIETGA